MRLDKRTSTLPYYGGDTDLMFTEFVHQYYEPHYAPRKSAERIRLLTAYFLDCFKDRKLKSITPADIEWAINTKAVAPRTRDYYLAIIRRIFNYAVELDFIAKSPVKVKQLNVDNTRQRYLRDEEVARLLEACQKSKSRFIYAMVVIAIYTGMRVGEIQKLKKADMVDGRLYIKSEYTKNSRNKIIPINGSLKAFLDEYLVEHDDFDFDHDYRRPFHTACKEASIEDFRFHDLRHTSTTAARFGRLSGSQSPSRVTA